MPREREIVLIFSGKKMLIGKKLLLPYDLKKIAKFFICSLSALNILVKRGYKKLSVIRKREYSNNINGIKANKNNLSEIISEKNFLNLFLFIKWYVKYIIIGETIIKDEIFIPIDNIISINRFFVLV